MPVNTSAKYVAKVDAEEVAKSPHCLSRRWGVKGRNRIPWGERIVTQCTPAQASQLMRMARRYVRSVTGKNYHFSRVSMNVFVNISGPWLRLIEFVTREEANPF